MGEKIEDSRLVNIFMLERAVALFDDGIREFI